MTLDRAALRAAAARSAHVAATLTDHPVNRMLREALGGDDADQLADAAERLLEQAGWVEDLLAPMIAAAGADPLFEPPFQANRDPVRFSTVLFDQPAVSVTATVVSADALAASGPARHVVVAGRLSVIRYARAKGAHRRVWAAEPAGPDFRAAVAAPCRALGAEALSDGAVVRLDGRTRGQVITGAISDLLTITATVRLGASAYVREYSVADGALLRCAMLGERPARTQQLLAYLRLAGRNDAGRCFAAATHDEAFFLRWPAMREWLALDVVGALPRLREMAEADPHDEVRAAARATLAMIAARREAICHA